MVIGMEMFLKYHRWAYDYSRYPESDVDFIPQNVPLSEEEKKTYVDH
jgi:hypothetical protein